MTLSEQMDAELLPEFERRMVPGPDGEILTLTAGDGPPLLMLHGDPQTHLCWHHQARELAREYSVALTDLRGRGDSHKPARGHDPEAFTKRTMAAEQLAVMRSLGHERFALVGHDRGARVARRLTLDHPEAVSRLVVMDIVPTLDFYDEITAQSAQDYFYFTFLTQPHPEPENLIAGDPRGFMRRLLTGLSDRPVDYHPGALETYIALASRPEAVAAMCECFRTGFHIDRTHDAEDRANGKRISCPTLFMWGELGVVGKCYDVRRIWSDWCRDVQFAPVQSGHFIPEEAPEAVLSALRRFLN